MAAAKRPGFNWFLAGNRVPRIGMALRFAFGCSPGLCAARLAHGQNRSRTHYSYAYNTLIGNGLQDYRLLDSQLFQRLFHPRQHRGPLALFQFHRPAHLQRCTDVFRQRLVPEHPHGRNQRQFQYRLVRQVDLPAHAAEQATLTRRGLYRLPDQRRQRRRTRRFRNGAVSPKRSSMAIRTRRAMASSSTRKKCRTSMDFPGS